MILEHFRREGWAALGQVADEALLAGLRERANQLMLGEVTIDGLFFQHDARSYDELDFGKGWVGPSLAYRKLEKLEKDERFRQLFALPQYRDVATEWIGPAVSLYRMVLFNKAAHTGSALPWHQDGGRFWGLDREPTLQIWLALDDAPPEAGCVQVVPGSHLGGLTTPEGGTIPAAILEAGQAEARAIDLPARAGEALLIHNHLWHRSGPNTTSRPRRAVTVCLMDAATRCRRKKHAPRQFEQIY